jgi:hypothetical protein
MRGDLVAYLSDALARAEAGGVSSPSGSWLAGMFGKAANLFEKEIRHYVRRLLTATTLIYPNDMPGAVKGCPPYEKLTLGQLLAVAREARKRNPLSVAQQTPTGWTPDSLVDAVGKINAAWVDTKHGEEVRSELLVACMKTMLTITKLLRPPE